MCLAKTIVIIKEFPLQNAFLPAYQREGLFYGTVFNSTWQWSRSNAVLVCFFSCNGIICTHCAQHVCCPTRTHSVVQIYLLPCLYFLLRASSPFMHPAMDSRNHSFSFHRGSPLFLKYSKSNSVIAFNSYASPRSSPCPFSAWRKGKTQG